MTKYLLPILALFLISCTTPSKNKSYNITYEDLKYAKGFRIGHTDSCTILEVKNPWDTSKLMRRYILIDKNSEQPTNLPDGEIIKVPVERVAASNTVHCGLLEKFGDDNKIVAVCEPEYIAVKSVSDGIKNKTISNLGMATMPNSELLVMSDADIMIVSPYQNQGYGWAAKINIPIIECAAYLEQLPLGQAEWIKFHALFYGKEESADSVFKSVEKNYTEIRDLTKNITKRPRLLAGKCYGQTWWVAAGESYAANLYKDAGADYIWSDTKGTGSISLSFESVYDIAHDADLWTIRYHDAQQDLSYDMLKAENKLYSEFSAFKNRQVYGCNTANTTYYEEATFYPDMALADLVKVFHPTKSEHLESKYYKHINK